MNGVSSPASTGGAGTFFEQQVNAYWLAQLLLRAIPPIILDCTLAEVHFQTEHLGWNTDDFLLTGQRGSGTERKLIGQVKRAVTVSAADEEFSGLIKDFWLDFKNPTLFSPTLDRFALVTLRGTNTLLDNFASLLDSSRATSDAIEFARRLSIDGFISAKSARYCNEIRIIVGSVEGRDVATEEIWPFLSVMHVLSLDLATTTRQTEATIKTLLAHTTVEPDPSRVADESWNALLALAADGMPTARRFRLQDLPQALRQRHAPVGTHDIRVLRSLSDHTAPVLGGIHSTANRREKMATWLGRKAAEGKLVVSVNRSSDPSSDRSSESQQ